jgi:hypothetical protein
MIPETKVNSLIYRNRLTRNDPNLEFADFAKNVLFAGLTSDGSKLVISIHETYFRNLFAGKLRQAGIIFDRRHNGDIFEIQESDFVRAIEFLSPEQAVEFSHQKSKIMKKYRTDSFKEAIPKVAAELLAKGLKFSLDYLLHHY